MATTIRTQDFLPVSLVQGEQKLPQQQHRPEHLFIHTARFWSMAAIVLLHSAGRLNRYQPVGVRESALLAQPFKFGTIAFFLISGFLVGDRLPSSNPLDYLRRRASRVLPAWLLWYGVEVLYDCQRDLLHTGRSALSLRLILSTVRGNSSIALFDTQLWFVPNFLVALTCVVLLRRWLNDLRLGAAVLAVNLFYGVNVYTEWVPSLHTQAVFGFVFYLWLGAWCALRRDSLLRWIRTLSAWWLALWASAAAGGSLLEAAILRAHHCRDSMNSLRFSNQIFAILMVLLLIRIPQRTWPSFVNVAETTYGIYLIHGIAIKLVFAVAARVLYAHDQIYGPVPLLLIWIVLAPIAYFVSLQFTRALASSPQLAWAVGAANSGARKRVATTLIASDEMVQA